MYNIYSIKRKESDRVATSRIFLLRRKRKMEDKQHIKKEKKISMKNCTSSNKIFLFFFYIHHVMIIYSIYWKFCCGSWNRTSDESNCVQNDSPANLPTKIIILVTYYLLLITWYCYRGTVCVLFSPFKDLLTFFLPLHKDVNYGW